MTFAVFWMLVLYPAGFDHAPEPVWQSEHATRAECEAAGRQAQVGAYREFKCVRITPTPATGVKMMIDIATFVAESNRIEGITRPPKQVEIDATTRLVMLPKLTIAAVASFVDTCQPGAKLRDKRGLNVRVGAHVAPYGGPAVAEELAGWLDLINAGEIDPWAAHVSYEVLHPFTDGNGRSGRAIWLWHMEHHCGGTELTFLHAFYYQTLSRAR